MNPMIADNTPTFLPAGECALVVEFGTTIDPAINAEVLALDRGLQAAAIAGVIETVPTYRSLLVHYDPMLITPRALEGRIGAIDRGAFRGTETPASWTLPVCYDEPFGEDIPYVASTLGLSPERVIALHAGATYRLYMYGFAPGFAYLGGLPSELSISRRTEPRARIEPNKLIIAGGQAIVTTVAMPAAWHILGETPEELFNPRRAPMFLLSVGDLLRFDAVDAATFAALKARVAQGEVVARREGAR